MASGWLDLGHPHETDGDFFRAHDVYPEDAPAYGEMHPLESGGRLRNAPSVDDAKWGLTIPKSESGWKLPSWAKKAAMGAAAAAGVGVVIVPVIANQGLISTKKTWHVAAVGGAVGAIAGTAGIAAYA